MIQVIFGLKLKYLRGKKGISLKSLSDSAGLSPSYINEIEKGKKYPKPEKIIQLAEALDVSYDKLVSTEMDESHNPLAAVLEAPLLRKFPFHIFGTSARELFQLMAGHPNEMSILARMLTELGRNYDMRVEHFFYTALRSYQVLHNNYFEDIEKAVEACRKTHNLSEETTLTSDTLGPVLEAHYDYTLDEEALTTIPELSRLRTAYAPKKLMINPKLSESQKAFAMARELGYLNLDTRQRALSSPTMEVGAFEQVYADFRASYFASALLIPGKQLKKDLSEIFANRDWSPELVSSLLTRYNTTPEMLFYRFSEIIPHYFRTKRVHFMKFSKQVGETRTSLDKQLNMSRVHIPNGIGLKEHFCRRWLSVQIIWDLEMSDDEIKVGSQISDFLDYGSEFFCIAIAYRNSLDPGVLHSVTIGFQVDTAVRKTIKFWSDQNIPRRRLGQTCERCPLPRDQCSERAAEPTTYIQEQAAKRRKELLLDLVSDEVVN